MLPQLVMAQKGPFGKWWHNPDISGQLNLTEQEKNRLDKQFVESRRKLIELKSDVQKQRFELETLLEMEELDEDALNDQFKGLEKARNKLANERFRFLKESRKILGKERFQNVKRMYKEKRRAKRSKECK
jgi:Spy/CpxP family protein refolding chaperone